MKSNSIQRMKGCDVLDCFRVVLFKDFGKPIFHEKCRYSLERIIISIIKCLLDLRHFIE